MASYNKTILLGNLTRDVELRFTQSGTAIGSFGLAVNRKWKDAQSGEAKSEVTFIDVTVFGKQAETLAQYAKKGSPLCLTGRLKTESWEDKQSGAKRSKLVVIAEEFQFIGTGTGSGESEAPSTRPAAKPKESAPAAKGDDDSSDVPF